jgi:hypothetical protein
VVAHLLLEPGQGGNVERRSMSRVPFFRPVYIGKMGEEPRFSAFTRDISPRSIGLLHVMPLECGKVIIRIPSEPNRCADLRAQIEWCNDCGEGWYISGGRFLGLAQPQQCRAD